MLDRVKDRLVHLRDVSCMKSIRIYADVVSEYSRSSP